MAGELGSIGGYANRVFAKRVGGFANRARDWPVWPSLEIATSFALVLVVVGGPFGTHAIGLGDRAAFWFILLVLNLLGWRLLINRFVRSPTDWPRVAAVGALLLIPPLPLEIRLALWFVGIGASNAPFWTTWADAGIIAALIYMAMLFWARPPRPATSATDESAAERLLMRWAIAPEQLAAVLAEDHYCRLVLADGGERLVHIPFGEAVAKLAAIPGLQVHRGAWIAQAAVHRAFREGRQWRVELTGGRLVKVSARHRGEAARRGLLRRSPAPLSG